MLRKQGVVPGPDRTAAHIDAFQEARLLERVAQRDLRAFEELYRIYHPRLTRFLTSLTHRAPLVEEILDDTLLVVWTRPETYNATSKLSTWIFAIAYRKALKAMRKQDEAQEDRDAEARPSPAPGPEQELEQSQLQGVLGKALSELSADHRTVVDLAYFHEVGYREIAEIMDCPVDTVKTRMFHARRHLKTKLSGALADWL